VLTTELLEQLAKRWREHGAPVASHLRAGLTAEQMDELTRPLGLHLSSEARTWWGWHDGADPALRLGTERDLGGPLQGFLTLEEAISAYRTNRDFLRAEKAQRHAEIWRASWLPVTAFIDGDFLVCDCGVAPSAPSPIHIVEWEDPDPSPRAASFEEMVSAWIEAIDVKRWVYDDGTRSWYSDDTRSVAGQRVHPLV
jgi:cell wall assembly regulator SMI1